MAWAPPLNDLHRMCESVRRHRGTQDRREIHGMTVTTLGPDLAKKPLQVHGVDERGKAVLRKKLRRGDMLQFFATLPSCVVGIAACGLVGTPVR
jgi:hypothetical protein